MGIATSKIQIRVLLIVGALIITYLFFAFYQKKFDTWNSQIIDRLFSVRSNIKPVITSAHEQIIHVDANLNAFRSQHAQVIRNLASMNIAVLAFDTIFSERVGEEEDLPLIYATEKAGNVFLGLRFNLIGPQAAGSNSELNAAKKQYLDATNWKVVITGNADRFPIGNYPVMTFQALASASRGLGHLNIAPDPDGILRRLPLLMRYKGAFYPSIAFQAVCFYFDVSPRKIIIQPGKSIILKDVRRVHNGSSQDLIIPIDANGNMILNYTGSWEKIRHFSYSEILQAHDSSEKFQKLKEDLSKKIVVMSEAVEAPIKIRPVSTNNHLSSGAIHTIVMQNILEGLFLRELSRTEMIFIEIAMLIAIFYLSIRFSAPTLSWGTFALGFVYVLVGVYSFIYFGLIFQFIRPLLILFCALLFILIAISVERAILFAETVRAKKLAERELEIGREIQAGFFPKTLPAPDGWELVTYFRAARHVAGDFYDAFSIGEKKHIGFVVADVCDKGVGAALFMALFRNLIRVLSGSTNNNNHLGNSLSHRDPAKTLKNTIHSVNNYISTTHETDGMFSTIFFGILNPESGVLLYINGGHEPPLIIGAGGIKASLCPTGPAVGLYTDAPFDVREIQLEAEDVLLAYTDGVVDAQNQAGESFTKKRLEKVVTESYLTAKDLIDNISVQIKAHNIGQEQFDDITILAIRRKTSSD